MPVDLAELVAGLAPVEGKRVGGFKGAAAGRWIGIGDAQRRVRIVPRTWWKGIASDALVPIEVIVAAQIRRRVEAEAELGRKGCPHVRTTGDELDLTRDDRFAGRGDLG